MRLARVIGKVTLSAKTAELPPGSYLLVRTLNRHSLAGADAGNQETLVAYDRLAAAEADTIALSEGREAACPFHPKRVPIDAYVGCIIDTLDYRHAIIDNPAAGANEKPSQNPNQ